MTQTIAQTGIHFMPFIIHKYCTVYNYVQTKFTDTTDVSFVHNIMCGTNSGRCVREVAMRWTLLVRWCAVRGRLEHLTGHLVHLACLGPVHGRQLSGGRQLTE